MRTNYRTNEYLHIYKNSIDYQLLVIVNLFSLKILPLFYPKKYLKQIYRFTLYYIYFIIYIYTVSYVGKCCVNFL